MPNTTDNTATAVENVDGWHVGYLLYIVEGFMMFALNLIVFLAIMRYEKLRKRKEYVIVGALALADAGNGLGTVQTLLYRTKWKSAVITIHSSQH